MKRIAHATLTRRRSSHYSTTVELLELASSDHAEARYLANVRYNATGSSPAPADTPLTAAPGPRKAAEQRARDFVSRRLAQGDVLVSQLGFDDLLQAPAAPTAPVQSTPDVQHALPAALKALLNRFDPDAWKLLSPERQTRSVWRLAEYADPSADNPQQTALRALVPRLVGMLGRSTDLMDYCLAVALGRLGDPGACVALAQLSTQAEQRWTRRAALEAHALLDPAAALQTAASSHLNALLPTAPFADSQTADAWTSHIEQTCTAGRCSWIDLLGLWYLKAHQEPSVYQQLLVWVRTAPLRPGVFQGLRYLYKTAEFRRDAKMLATLHARFETTAAYYRRQSGSNRMVVRSGEQTLHTPLAKEMGKPQPRLAYSQATRDHLRRRGWRTLRRLAGIDHRHAVVLAVELLLTLDDDDLPSPRQETRWEHIDGRYQRVERHYHPASGWWLVSALLLARHPHVQRGPRNLRWWTSLPLSTDQAMADRCEALPAMWDQHPDALLTLALHSRCALVHAVVARALQDHRATVSAQDRPVLQQLLQSAYAPTALLAYGAVKTRIEQSSDMADQAGWLLLLLGSTAQEPRDFALAHLAENPLGFARHVDLVVALLLLPHERARRHGQGLVPLADAKALLLELQQALLAWDASEPGAINSAELIEELLRNQLQPALFEVGLEPLLGALQHPSDVVLRIAVSWLLLHPAASDVIPVDSLTELLRSEQPTRLAQGLRLLSALPDEVLRTQSELLARFALSPHPDVRQAISAAAHRLIRSDPTFAASFAQRLHASLFLAEPADGVHDDALTWLQQALAAHAPALDAASIWRALQAQSGGAQRYGAWGLDKLSPADFSLRQLATLGQHPLASVRSWACHGISTCLPAHPSPEQVADLLPLADTRFDDARSHAQHLFATQLADESLPVELLVAWIDHTQPWVQDLGKQRLVRSMNAAEASLCLTRLSQHPSPGVQLFVTQWLLDMPQDDPAALAARLQQLVPYFLTVLSQVHRGRVAKTRVIAFLRGCVHSPLTAAVVAQIFSRQVVSCSLTDKPQYIAGLRDIQRLHPQIDLPFIRWRSAAPQHEATSEVNA